MVSPLLCYWGQISYESMDGMHYLSVKRLCVVSCLRVRKYTKLNFYETWGIPSLCNTYLMVAGQKVPWHMVWLVRSSRVVSKKFWADTIQFLLMAMGKRRGWQEQIPDFGWIGMTDQQNFPSGFPWFPSYSSRMLEFGFLNVLGVQVHRLTWNGIK